MSDLTDRQRAILEFIRDTHRRRGYPPSVREIGDAVGLQSPSSVHAQLSTLAARGYLRKDPTRPRAIVVTADPSGRPVAEPDPADVRRVPLLGQIAAGSPLLAEENLEETIPVPDSLVAAGTLFALRVKGDSMLEAGILDGDTVIVRQQPDADDGDIVAALVGDDEATVKRLRRRGSSVTLEPANPAYEPISSDEVRVLGRVVAVLRRL